MDQRLTTLIGIALGVSLGTVFLPMGNISISCFFCGFLWALAGVSAYVQLFVFPTENV